MNRSYLSILRCFHRSLTNQQIENYHVTTLLMLLRSFELSAPNVYDSVKTPLVCTRELLNFKFFAQFVQIIRVCGRAFNLISLLHPLRSPPQSHTFQYISPYTSPIYPSLSFIFASSCCLSPCSSTSLSYQYKGACTVVPNARKTTSEDRC